MTDSAQVLSIGQKVFGGYVVSDKLGEGGMGVVYAIANETLNRRLALKLLLPQWSRTPQIVQRFLAEARAATAIRHPNIIDILDAAQFDDGSHYMLMEFLEGDALDKFLHERGPVPVETALEILSQVCSGLQAAHDRGIVHRDLKPANLFIAPSPTNPLFTKILDFGIAKLTDPSLAGDLRTMTNTIIGTPSYMSPEQARGAKDIDHRTDIYALAVIAYELLAGALPYSASSLGDLVYKQATAPPQDLSELRGDLPAEWRSTIMSALSTDPNDRPQSAREFLERLTVATPGPGPQTVWLPQPVPAKRPRWLAPVIVAALIAVGGAGLGLSQRSDTEASPDVVAADIAKPAPAPKQIAKVEHKPVPLLYRKLPLPDSRADTTGAKQPGSSTRTRPPRRRRRSARPKSSAVAKPRRPAATKTTKTKRPNSSKPKPPAKPRAFDPNAVGG